MAIDSITSTPETGIAGENMTISTTITNAGNTALSNISYNITITEGSNTNITTGVIPSLAVGESTIINTTYTPTTSGTIHIESAAAPLTDEDNTINNQMDKYIATTDLPNVIDLSSFTFTLENGTTDTVNANDTIFFELTIGNVGSENKTLSYVNITLDPGLVLNTTGESWTETGNLTNVFVEAGTNVHKDWQIEAPQSGTYNIIITSESGLTTSSTIVVN